MNLILNLESARFVTGAHVKPLSGRVAHDMGARVSKLALPEALDGEKMRVRVFRDRVEVHSDLRGRISVFSDSSEQASIKHLERLNKSSDQVSALPVAGTAASDLQGSWAKKVAQSKHMHKATSVASSFFKADSMQKTHSKFEAVVPYMQFSGIFAWGAAAVGLATSFESYRDAKRLGASKTLQKEHATATLANATKLTSYSIKIAEAGAALRTVQVASKAILKTVGKVAAGFAGIGSLLGAALGTWKIYKKDRFFARIENSTSGVQDTAEKAKNIWSAFQQEIAINERKVENKLESFKDLDSIQEKLSDLKSSFERGTGYRLETIGHALDSARTWVKGKLGYKAKPGNARHNKEMAIASYMRSLQAQLNQLDQGVFEGRLSPEDADIQKHDLLNAAKYKLEREVALCARAKDIASVTSSTFANMLVSHQGVVDVKNRLHQRHIIQIHDRMVKNYKENRMWEISTVVMDYIGGVIGLVGIFVPGGLVIKIITNAFTAHWFGSLVMETFGQKIKRLIGIEVSSSFDSDIKSIYAKCTGMRFTRLVA